MQYHHRTSLLWLWSIFLFAACAPPSPKEETSILPTNLELRPGDIVFRQGTGLDSRTVMTIDRNSSYSHIGIVVDSAGVPMIVHAVPDEPDFPGDFDRIKMDSPTIFFLHSRAQIGEVMRPLQQAQAQIAAQTALRLYKKRIPFDHKYDDNDSTEMYCTELIDYAFRSAGIELTHRNKREIGFPFPFKGYFPSDFHASPNLVSIRIF